MRAMCNTDIRGYLSRNRVYGYEVAEKLQISTPTLYVWLQQKNLSEERKELIRQAVRTVAEEREQARREALEHGKE